MGARRRRGSDSRCCNASLAPMMWVDFVDPVHPSVSDLDQWLQGLPPFARVHEEGEIEELMEAAAAGQLWDSGDATTHIKPIREDPEVFELRRSALSKKLRFYHGEPAELPRGLVALHRHIKTSDAAQQVEIEYTAGRYQDGRTTRWSQP